MSRTFGETELIDEDEDGKDCMHREREREREVYAVRLLCWYLIFGKPTVQPFDVTAATF